MEGAEPADAVEMLLNELQDLKACIVHLKEENKRLSDSFIHLKNENVNLQHYINSLEATKPPSPEAPRKQPKIDNNNLGDQASARHVNVITPNSNINSNANTECSKDNNPKQQKIIQAIDTNISSVLKTVKNANCQGFTIKQTNANAPVKITINKAEEIPVIRDALKNSNISFHEFKWESEKQQGFLIRGLVGITEDRVPEVFDELVKAGIPKEAKLSLYVTGHMRANPGIAHNTLLKLVLPPNFDSTVLKKIKYIDHVVVSFEKIKAKTVVQCINCQRFGHTAAGCQHTHRCVKCGLNHLREQCPRTFNKTIKLVCCNCGGEHTANNLSVCPYYTKNFKKDVSTNNSSTANQTATSKISSIPISMSRGRSSASIRSTGVSYATIANMSANNNNSNSNNKIDVLMHKFTELTEKADIIYQLVLKHDAILQKLTDNE